MNPDQLIRIILRSRTVLNDLSELYHFSKQIDSRRADQLQIIKEISDYQMSERQGSTPPQILYTTKDWIAEEIKKLEKITSALEEKIRLSIVCELSASDQRGQLLLNGARKFYKQFKSNSDTEDVLFSSKYSLWAKDFLEEAIRIGFFDAEVYFLLGSIYSDLHHFSIAYDHFSDSFNLDDTYIKALSEKIRIGRILINEGDEWRKTEVLQDERRLEELSTNEEANE